MASDDRKSQVAKAGKRHGMVTYPPPPNTDKQAAREMGERQFISKSQQYVERIVTVYNRPTMRFGQKTVTVPVDFSYDTNRKRAIHSPTFKEKGR